MMDEQIKSNLALEIAQLSLDKATLQAQVSDLQTQVSQFQSELDKKTELETELKAELEQLKVTNQSLTQAYNEVVKKGNVK